MAPFQRQSQDQNTVLEHMCGLDIYSEPYSHRQVCQQPPARPYSSCPCLMIPGHEPWEKMKTLVRH